MTRLAVYLYNCNKMFVTVILQSEKYEYGLQLYQTVWKVGTTV